MSGMASEIGVVLEQCAVVDSSNSIMPLLKSIWKGSNKHKKLSDELDLAANQDFDGDDFSLSSVSSYKVKYLGHLPVESSGNTQDITTNAIESIISLSKANKKLTQKVIVSVNMKGIDVSDLTTEKTLFDVSIYRICSCLASAKSKRVFAFLATDVKETTECHAFLCSNRSTAEKMAMTVAQTFTAVYQMWQTARRSSIGTLYYRNATILPPPLPSYTEHGTESYNTLESAPGSSVSCSKWISFEGSLKDASLASTRSLAFAEVYPSPPAYSEKPFSGDQIFDSQEWPEMHKSAELIVF